MPGGEEGGNDGDDKDDEAGKNPGGRRTCMGRITLSRSEASSEWEREGKRAATMRTMKRRRDTAEEKGGEMEGRKMMTAMLRHVGVVHEPR
jgi:hypothetical protein